MPSRPTCCASIADAERPLTSAFHPSLRYESARLVHGRPLALPGNEYANLFLHFRPRGWEKTRPELGACTRTADHQNVMGGGLVIGEMMGRWRFQDEREAGGRKIS